MKKILCLHGFLGSPSDFAFLEDKFECIIPDLNQYVHLDIKSLHHKLVQDYDLSGEVIILGYSFGARLAAQLFHIFPNSFTKLIMLAGHLGLKESELDERKKIEDIFLDKLEHVSSKDFSTYWNSLDLFKFDQKAKLNISDSAKFYFKNYALSKQPYLADKLVNKRDFIYIFYGELDIKYSQYAKTQLNDFNVSFLSGLGHRLLQSQNVVHSIVKDIVYES